MIIYHLLEKYYPQNVPIGLGETYINLMFLKKPIVEATHITFHLAGDVFSMLDHPELRNVNDYKPTGNIMRPIILDEMWNQVFNFQLSLTLYNVQKILYNVFRNLKIPIDNKLVNVFNIDKIVFSTKNNYGLTIVGRHFHLKNLTIKLRTTRDNTVFTALASMIFRINYIDVVLGKIHMDIMDLNLMFKTNQISIFFATEMDFILNLIRHALVHTLHRKVLDVEQLKLNLKPGMLLSPIYFSLRDQMVSLVLGFRFDTNVKNTNFFLQSSQDIQDELEEEEVRVKTRQELETEIKVLATEGDCGDSLSEFDLDQLDDEVYEFI
jgi:hypothetical protein